MAFIRLQGEQERRNHIYYQVDSSEQPIGVGGMGQVFKGFRVDERNGNTRPVAIKFMFNDLPPQAIERARREASIQLRNDNLVEMLGFLEIDERNAIGDTVKHYHVVSELLSGVSLDSLLEGNVKDRDGHEVPYAVKLLQDYRNDPEHFARHVVMNILSGLMALHDAGYIHRDIDPSNIMVTTDGHIKLIDFGIAKQMTSLTTSDKQLTVAGKFMGKPEYAAPELALGDVQHQNQTTDIYAVGILLFQLIVGHTPFEGPRHEILEKQLKSRLPLNVIKNKALRKIVQKACEKKQELRYQTSAQMRVALETMKDDGASAMSLSADVVKKIMMGGLAAVAVIGVVIAIMLWPKSPADDTTLAPVTVLAQEEPKDEYQQITDLLQTSEGAQEGLSKLEEILKQDPSALSGEERARYASAAYLMSRLCFKSKASHDYIPDSILLMQQNLSIAVDYNRAHQLLLATLQADSTDYHALYELGCDYLGGDARTEAVERNIPEADKYLKKALRQAQEKHDTRYVDLIQEQISRYADDNTTE
ncbi:MAG: serine/threonine protein kinase [Prevotella sp.]|nr:serine/threonine protein kinase [Prevotella sp.]